MPAVRCRPSAVHRWYWTVCSDFWQVLHTTSAASSAFLRARQGAASRRLCPRIHHQRPPPRTLAPHEVNGPTFCGHALVHSLGLVAWGAVASQPPLRRSCERATLALRPSVSSAPDPATFTEQLQLLCSNVIIAFVRAGPFYLSDNDIHGRCGHGSGAAARPLAQRPCTERGGGGRDRLSVRQPARWLRSTSAAATGTLRCTHPRRQSAHSASCACSTAATLCCYCAHGLIHQAHVRTIVASRLGCIANNQNVFTSGLRSARGVPVCLLAKAH